MPRTRSHYENLKVARNAPSEVIRAAYKALAHKYHPDRNAGAPEAARIMSLVNEAYRVLSDPELRRQHDAWLRSAEPAPPGSGAPCPASPAHPAASEAARRAGRADAPKAPPGPMREPFRTPRETPAREGARGRRGADSAKAVSDPPPERTTHAGILTESVILLMILGLVLAIA